MKRGDSVTWMYTPRGGYGYTTMVDALIVKVNAKTVTIEVEKKSGERVLRRVKMTSLLPKSPHPAMATSKSGVGK